MTLKILVQRMRKLLRWKGIMCLPAALLSMPNPFYLPRSDHLFHLNYAITLYNNEEIDRARDHFEKFEQLFKELDEDVKGSDSEVLEQRQALGGALGIPLE